MTDEWGIDDGYHDVDGVWRPTPPDTRDALRSAMGDPVDGPPRWFVVAGATPGLHGPCDVQLEDGTVLDAQSALPPDLPIGYHQLQPLDGGPVTHLVIHPATAPPADRTWGVAAQVYALWSDRSWGIGDLEDVATLARRVADAGGGAVLLSPLHAEAPVTPQERSPYFPSSRRWRSPLLVRPRGEPPAPLRCDALSPVDRDAAWVALRAALAAEMGFDHGPWRDWADAHGADLTSYARWSALAEVHGANWQEWPHELRHPHGDGIERAFAESEMLSAAADLHRYLQWRAHEAIDRAGRAGAGLVNDLAVGFSPWGFDAWEHQDLLVLGARIGAPPDTFNRDGQDWGSPPFVPTKLRACGFEPFLATVRAALHGAEGLRLDHVMGLFRQFWIPEGGDPEQGAYVRFPGRELLALLSLEAHRAGAFLVGEDLGTVEPAVREAMAEFGVLGTLVALFEDDEPADWREACLATIVTHDLPTTSGMWLDAPPENAERLRLQRLAGVGPDATAAELVDGAHRALLASPPVVRLLTCEDLAGSTHRPNTPGTVGPHNWSTRLPLPVDELPLP